MDKYPDRHALIMELQEEMSADPKDFTFYANGAVADEEGNFVIKADGTHI